SGYGIHFSLPRLMSKEEFGLYQVVIGLVSIINAVVITGTYQTVSKYISQEESKADAVKSKALKLQVIVGGGAALGFFLLAPGTASYMNDARLINYLRLASLITLAYSFYAVFTGYFNGQKKFLTQAALDMTYSTLKLGFIVLLVWLGYGVTGGVGGFALAATSILIISAVLAGRGARLGDVKAGDLLKFQSYLLLFTLVLNLLQKVDLMLVKALSSPVAKEATENAASYGAAVNLANITYQIIISATFVIFPLVSQSTFVDDREKTRLYISNTTRYTLMVMALVATLLSANSAEVLRVVYPEEYQDGSLALGIVAYGMLFFGLLYVITTIISASGRPAVSLMIGGLTLAASAVLNALLIPRFSLAGAATGTTVAMLVGVIAGSVYLIRMFRAFLPIVSFIRIAASGTVVGLLSILIVTDSKVMTLAQLAALSLVYFAMLLLTRELGGEDLTALKKVIKI
ncbi:MAG TPA: oligosaccharide flippase family protein, partial [Blastocatellia bacterium]|nr:oligosaccharide flippase family protein [Blastocatellia bacterium]